MGNSTQGKTAQAKAPARPKAINAHDESEQSLPRFRCVTLGTYGVGKTTLKQQFFHGEFRRNLMISYCSFQTKIVWLNRQIKVKIGLDDTCGEERYRAISQLYLRDAVVALLVCSVDDLSSLKKTEMWIQLTSEARLDDKFDIILVGSKIDLPVRQFTYEQGQKWAHQHHLEYREVSSLTGQGIDELFQFMLHLIYRRLITSDN